jgi:hypothetical protein
MSLTHLWNFNYPDFVGQSDIVPTLPLFSGGFLLRRMLLHRFLHGDFSGQFRSVSIVPFSAIWRSPFWFRKSCSSLNAGQIGGGAEARPEGGIRA